MRGLAPRGIDNPPRFTPTRYDHIRFDGGLDLETPPLDVETGRARSAQNYEQCPLRGYRRITGYERYDGRPSPSDALYGVLPVTITGATTLGAVVTQPASGAYGTLIYVGPDYFVLTQNSGTFTVGFPLQIAGLVVATVTSPFIFGAANTQKEDAQFHNLAADEYRADILEVPGSGNVFGVALLYDQLYAWRNNAGGTAAAIWKASVAGWVAVPLGRVLKYTAGNAIVAEGATLTGATSLATAVITRHTLGSGSFGAGTATGNFVFASMTGAFINGENLQVGGVTKAVANGVSVATTLLPNGHVETVAHNFTGAVGLKRLYGCDRVNPGFEFDGTVYVPIATGMTVDTPQHVTVHKNHLFFSFGSSLQHSGVAAPHAWTALLGAAELAMGDVITGLVRQPGNVEGGALFVTTRNKLAILYGASAADWQLVDFDAGAGAIEYSPQHIGLTVMMDDRGLTSFQTSANFGNFLAASFTEQIQQWIALKKTLVCGSTLWRSKNQYRLFFTDQYGLYVTFQGQQIRGMVPVFFPHRVACTWSGERESGEEVAFFGSTSGYVYQFEKGTSFDGDPIEAWLYLALDHTKSPRQLKRWKRGILEAMGEGYAELYIAADLAYGDPNVGQTTDRLVTSHMSTVTWDAPGATWDVGTWDPQSAAPIPFRLDGTSDNVGLKVYSNSDYFASITLTSALIDYSMRRRLR